MAGSSQTDNDSGIGLRYIFKICWNNGQVIARHMAENRKDVDGGCTMAQDDLRESGQINR